MNRVPRVAFFTDSYAESNGVARLSRALVSNASRRQSPFLCIHGGDATEMVGEPPVQRLVLGRGPAKFSLEHDLSFDLLLWRHYALVRGTLERFRPDVIHITGPSDVGQLGALLGHRLSIPMVASWHTNVHQYAALRAQSWCRWLPASLRAPVLAQIERRSLAAALLFYKIPRALMAPNAELVALLGARTGKPTHLMKHGVDVEEFTPRRRSDDGGVLRLGFVGRLSAEKNVRVLAAVSRLLDANAVRHELLIVGEGSERAWLQSAIPQARFCGVLTGDALADAYASLDLFVFPSPSETFGLVVLEAMASGVPVLAMNRGGPGFIIEHGISGWLANDTADFLTAALTLARDGEARRRLAAAARGRASAWSWSAVADDLCRIYCEVAANASHSPGFERHSTTGANPRSVASPPATCHHASSLGSPPASTPVVR